MSYTLIREGNARYGESYNGIHYTEKYMPRANHLKPGPNGQVPGGQGVRDRDFRLDPYIVKGTPASGLLPLVNEGDPGTPGDPAPGVQAYCFRLCLSTAEDRLPIEAPLDYDPKRYELVARFIEACREIGDLSASRKGYAHRVPSRRKADFPQSATSGAAANPAMGYALPHRLRLLVAVETNRYGSRTADRFQICPTQRLLAPSRRKADFPQSATSGAAANPAMGYALPHRLRLLVGVETNRYDSRTADRFQICPTKNFFANTGVHSLTICFFPFHQRSLITLARSICSGVRSGLTVVR